MSSATAEVDRGPNWKVRKYVDLLRDDTVDLWLDEIGRNSKAARQSGRNRLGFFLESTNLTPKTFREMEKKVRDELVTRFIREQEKRGLLEATNRGLLRYIRSYARFNDLELRKIPLKRTGTNSENERVPLKEEVADILYHRKASPRATAEIALIAFSGIRIEVLGNFDGTDGLRVGDIPDLKVDSGSGKVSFAKMPATINVRRTLSKNHHKYFTFLPEEGCEIVKDFLEHLAAKGEAVNAQTFLSLSSPRLEPRGYYKTREPHPQSSQDVGNEIRKVLRPKYTFRPYLFRSYFDSGLEMAESRRAITHSQRQFWMGHTGDIETVYSTRKELNGDQVEEMRRAFVEASKYLETRGQGPVEVVKEQFAAKDKEHEEALTRIRLELLESREKQREQDATLKQLAALLAEMKAERQKELATKGKARTPA